MFCWNAWHWLPDFKQYEEYMKYLQNLACGEIVLFYYHKTVVSHVFMCERCGKGFFFFSFWTPYFQMWDFSLVIDVFTDMLE